MKRAFKIGAGETCCGMVTDPFMKRKRREASHSMVCGKDAHYDVDGKAYCAAHASTAALAILMLEERLTPDLDLLEGFLCEGCGAVIDGKAVGHARYCSKACEPPGYISLRSALNTSTSPRARQADRHNRERREVARSRKPFGCDQCPKLCRTPEGLAQHKRDKHGGAV